MGDEVPTYTIIQADGLYPGDDEYEKNLFAPQEGQNYKVNYLQVDLYPVGARAPKPWSAVPEEIRNQVDGIEVLKMGFTAEDAALFPRLKV
jgi:C-terminal binding protein